MVAPGVGPGQKQLYRAFRLAQTGHGGRSRRIDDKDQHAVGRFFGPLNPQVAGAQVDQPLGHANPAQGLPGHGGAQGRHQVQPLFGRGATGARGKGATAPVARARFARAGRAPQGTGGTGRRQMVKKVGRQERAHGLDHQVIGGGHTVLRLGVAFGRARFWRRVGRLVGPVGQTRRTMGKDQFRCRRHIVVVQAPVPAQGCHRPRCTQGEQNRPQTVDPQGQRHPGQRCACLAGQSHPSQPHARRRDPPWVQDRSPRRDIVQRQEQPQPVGQRAGQPFALFRRLVQRNQTMPRLIQRLRQPRGHPGRTAFCHGQDQSRRLGKQPLRPHRPACRQGRRQVQPAEQGLVA